MDVFQTHYVCDIRCFLEVNWNVKVNVTLPVTLSHGFSQLAVKETVQGFHGLTVLCYLVLDIENYCALSHCPNFTFPSSRMIGKHYPNSGFLLNLCKL